MEYGETTECPYMFTVVSIRLWTKYYRKQVQNFRTSLGTECLGKLLTRNILYFVCAFFSLSDWNAFLAATPRTPVPYCWQC